MKKYFKLLLKQEKTIKIFLVLYAIYCSIKIGMSWDEEYYHKIGEINLKYLLSFGQIEDAFAFKYRFSTLYWSVSSLISQIFPQNFNLEVFHIINTFFGLFAIVGLYKLNKILFNETIAKIASIFIFLTPFYFGHLAINNKDIILAFAHIWIIYYIYKYTFHNHSIKKRLYIILKLSVLFALGTGIQLLFLGSLLPIILVFFIIIFLYKKKNLKIILLDFVLFILLFYTILILFWVDTHDNIFILPFIFIEKTFSMNVGWPFNILNGNYIYSNDIPLNYLLTNYLYKLPEFLLFLYFVSIPIFFFNKELLKKRLVNFKKIITLIFFLLLFPTFVLTIIPYPIYDGLRLFLWSVPYLVIIPAIVIYLIFINNSNFYKILKMFFSILFLFHIFNFITITPYHYTFLNYFAGEKKLRYQKFENDYWSTSLKELILSSNLGDDKVFFYSCGVNPEIAKFYMKKKYKLSKLTNKENATYIVMTNRTLFSEKDNKITNCYDEYNLENVHQISRNGIILSTIKKLK